MKREKAPRYGSSLPLRSSAEGENERRKGAWMRRYEPTTKPLALSIRSVAWVAKYDAPYRENRLFVPVGTSLVLQMDFFTSQFSIPGGNFLNRQLQLPGGKHPTACPKPRATAISSTVRSQRVHAWEVSQVANTLCTKCPGK